MHRPILLFIVIALLAPVVHFARATDFSSTNFTVEDPVIVPASGFSSSTSFSLESTLGGFAIGSSTANAFGLRSGFLYFIAPPSVPSGLAASAVSTSQIDLSWASAVTNETGFRVERKTGAGGAYAEIASPAANAVSYSDTGLTAGTTYFYRIRAVNDAGASGYSNEIGATTSSSAGSSGGTVVVGSSGGGGAGLGAGPVAADTNVTLKGIAYPKTAVTVLLDGALQTTVTIDAGATFSVSLAVPVGVRSFSLYSTDTKGRRSLTYTFTLAVQSGVAATVDGIFLAPVIEVDKSEVRRGDVVNILGQTAPSSTVNVFINSEEEIVRTVSAGADGTYLLAFNTQPLEYGDHTAKSQARIATAESAYSRSVAFRVSTRSVAKVLPGDLNKDGKVNIVDFSILLFHWNKGAPQNLTAADINNDSKINLKDLSIQLYYWTG